VGVLTLTAAARLLAAADSAAALHLVARHCGFAGDPLPLDAAGRRALGLPASIRVATVSAGVGVLRALCVECAPGTLRSDSLGALALAVQRASPFASWLVLATERRGRSCGLATAQLAPQPQTALLCYDRTRIVDSDAETLRAMAAASEGVDLLVHLRWHELLGREAITQRFFRALEGSVDTMARALAPAVPADAARTLALHTATRCLFLAFLQAKGWLDGDHGFLHQHWDRCTAGRGGFHRRVLNPLFFGTLNTPVRDRATTARAFGRVPFLNGGLFTRTVLEKTFSRQYIPDEALSPLLGDVLTRWRFTVREEHSTRSEAAVDPEMLGRAFEALMASPERRQSGSFYTPPALVAHVADHAFASSCAQHGLADTFNALRSGAVLSPADAAALGAHLRGLTVLDPACGSGAFLVHALESLAAWRATCGDGRDLSVLRRDVLTRQLFGVDRHPTAVWLCELRLWLAVVVETPTADPYAVPPLPNLDANIRVGDALAGAAFSVSPVSRTVHPLRTLRQRYSRATGARKRTLGRALLVAERSAAVTALELRIASLAARRRDTLSALRSPDLWGTRPRADASTRDRLQALRAEVRALRHEIRALRRGGSVAFDFAAQFADVGARGGFDVVLGNPPWVRLHHIPPLERARLRARYRVYRDAAWRAGAAAARAGTGFAAQVDLAALFVERALELLAPEATLALLVPTKLWRSLAGAGVRDLVRTEATVHRVEDWSDAPATFDAAVYPSVVVATRGRSDTDHQVTMAAYRGSHLDAWQTASHTLPFDDTTGAPWIFLPPAARSGFDALRAAGPPLGAHDGLRPRLGVKCGCNDAFLGRVDDFGRLQARDGHTAEIEPALLRPLLRGDAVTPWRIVPGAERIVVPHDAALAPLTTLPPGAKRWLSRWRSALVERTDYKGRGPWWTLFRTDAADPRTPRVVWADMSRTPRAAVLPVGDRTVPLNTCYVVPTADEDEAHAIAAWLNSPLAAAWLGALAEPARGGYRRLLGWTVALLPLPADWPRAVRILAPVGARGAAGEIVGAAELLDAAIAAVDLPLRRIDALVRWSTL
jgi:hypothetical protein